jgi:hypothetical protein
MYSIDEDSDSQLKKPLLVTLNGRNAIDLGEVGGASSDVVHEEVGHPPLVVPGHELGRLARST